jgi:hypothetical protein
MGEGRLAYYVMDRLLTFSRVDATICDYHKSARGAAFFRPGFSGVGPPFWIPACAENRGVIAMPAAATT